MCRAIAAADAEYIYIAEIQLREKIFPLVHPFRIQASGPFTSG
jgi:hypothetical protein